MTFRTAAPVHHRILRIFLLLAALGSVALGAGAAPRARRAVHLPLVVGSSDPVLVGAGDISSCYSGNTGDAATATLLDAIPGTVFTAGDNAYPDGTLDQYNNCYDPTWGRLKARTRPAAGNHEYHTRRAAGYFTYFGAAAGNPTKGYYSYDLGAWHIIVINSNCEFVGGCQAGSPQERWLRADLVAHPVVCTLAIWHHPRFSSGFHESNEPMAPIWQALYDAGADVVVNGHSHNYERFAPQDPAGRLDRTRGLREFVVGTGGDKFQPMGAVLPNSEVRNNTTHGVLKLTLHPRGYDWVFIPIGIAGQTFTDRGASACH
jgi:calcineurin-like phosphoesterase family protein